MLSIQLFITLVLCVLLLVSTLIFIHHLCLSKYWQSRNLPFIYPLPLLGNLKDLLFSKISFGEQFLALYRHRALSRAAVGGIYILNKPALLLREPELIQFLFIKNFHSFANRYEAASRNDRSGSLALALAKYPAWRASRLQLCKVFTSGQLRERRYPLMLQIAEDLEKHLLKIISPANEGIIEVKELCSLFTTDLTSLVHFGVHAGGLKKGHSEVRKQTLKLLKVSFYKTLTFMVIFFLPHLTDILRIRVFPQSYMKFIKEFVAAIRKQRRGFKTSESQDLLGNLLRLERTGYPFANHPDFITAQAAIFLLAGFETSSSVLALTLYELAKQPEIQQRLRQEINAAFKEKPSLSFDQLQQLSYLHQVVCEGLRMYPSAAFINRECTPLQRNKGFNFTTKHGPVRIPKGMPVYVSILGLHRDEKYWPQPDFFNPERFSSKNICSVFPSSYLPFGIGPHGCIGSRLGLLQIKLGLAHILKICRVEECSKTMAQLKFDEKSFIYRIIMNPEFVNVTTSN
uniref:Cytochrome P450 n=1 Tax=Glossina austeni TaxID=7395 RepID=A0A1A9V3C3_GLOAU